MKIIGVLLVMYSMSSVHSSPQPVGENEESQEKSLPKETNNDDDQLFDLLEEEHTSISHAEQNDNLRSGVLSPPPPPPPDKFSDYVKLKTENYHVGEASVELNIEYNLEAYNNFYINGIYKSRINENAYTTNPFFRYHFRDNVNQDSLPTKGSVTITAQLPTELIYYDHLNKSIPTNYFAKEIEFEANLVIVDPQDGFEVTSVNMESLFLPIPNPWDRKQKPLYCLNWYSGVLEILKTKSIPKCNRHSNNKIFEGILPSSGESNLGYLRPDKEILFPKHVSPELLQQFKSSTGQTVTFWMFLTKKCTKNGCFVLQHRNATNFHKLVVILNRDILHIQMHDEFGNGEAFQVKNPLPLHKWIFVMLNFNRSQVKLGANWNGLNYNSVYSRHFGEFQNGNTSYWSAGGYFVNAGFSGYLSKLNVYHHTLLDFQQYVKHFLKKDKKELDNIIPESQYQKCVFYHNTVNSVWGIETESLKTCSWTEFFHQPKSNLCYTPEFQKVKEILMEVKKQLRQSGTKSNDIATGLYEIVMKNLTKKFSADLLPILKVAGCLGNGRSYFVMATIYKYGIGSIEIDQEKALSYQLMAAQLSDPLAHLSLSYRYQLSLDGLDNDVDLQAAHMRQAAILTKHELDQEKYKINTQSELIRLDEASAISETRGRSSELYKWLSQQAKMGSLEAKNQMADMLFHGKQGVEANPEQAMEHFHDLADAGDPAAMVNLAVMHIKGVNVEKNLTKAKLLLEKAVAKNSSFAYNVLGFVEIHFNHNMTRALEYWKKGLDGGDLQSSYNYASVMESLNKTESIYHYEKAASLGERHSCFRLGELLMEGTLIARDPHRAIQLFKLIAELHESIGWFMRDAIKYYLNGKRYASLLNHLLALESGLQLAGYNVALLLKEMIHNQEDAGKLLRVHDPHYYVNFTAELGWSTSLKEMGDYSWTQENDTKKASVYYTRAVHKNNHPEALYSLGYMVENHLSLDHSIRMENASSWTDVHGNLSIAAKLYQSCMTSIAENGEGYYPCQLAMVKLQAKMFFQSYVTHYLGAYVFELACGSLLLAVLIPIIGYQIVNT